MVTIVIIYNNLAITIIIIEKIIFCQCDNFIITIISYYYNVKVIIAMQKDYDAYYDKIPSNTPSNFFNNSANSDNLLQNDTPQLLLLSLLVQ